MSSVQEREQSSDAASESGFFEKGHPFAGAPFAGAPLAEAPFSEAGAFPGESVAASDGDAGEVTAVSAVVRGARAEELRAEEAVLRAFGEVRSLNAELQRANDALHIVNERLRGKMDQLRTTALDLEQMLDGVELGVLLLDEDLSVRHFNDMAAHFLGLGSHDVGGSISASCRAFGPRLVEWCREVLRTGRRLRRTFQSAIGEPLTLHVRRARVDGEARLVLVFTETA
jgi:nitrogen fixation/metabolism regulation signal transduction histidine kinase